MVFDCLVTSIKYFYLLSYNTALKTETSSFPPRRLPDSQCHSVGGSYNPFGSSRQLGIPPLAAAGIVRRTRASADNPRRQGELFSGRGSMEHEPNSVEGRTFPNFRQASCASSLAGSSGAQIKFDGKPPKCSGILTGFLKDTTFSGSGSASDLHNRKSCKWYGKLGQMHHAAHMPTAGAQAARP